MKRTILHKSVPAVLFFIFLFVDGLPVFSQQIGKGSKPVVVLTALASPPGDTLAGTLASTLTSSIELMLKLTGRVTLRRADFLIPTTSLERTIPYYDEHKAAEAVYGSVTATANGEYAIDLDVWNASRPNANPTVLKRTISNVLSSFNLADEMSLEVASTIVGRKLEEGTLVVRNVSSLPKFSVYANGHLLGRNRTSFHILTGNWKIVVAKPGELGDVPVQTFHVDMLRGATTKVTLTQVPPRQAVVLNKGTEPQKAKPTLSKTVGVSSTNEPLPVLTVSHATGSIAITTATAGTIYLDGRNMGHIPAGGATLSSVGVGIRALSMQYADGHVVRKEVTVRAGSATMATFDYRVIPGTRWTQHTLPISRDWDSVAYGKGTFVAVPTVSVGSPHSNVVATSSNGVDWTDHALPSSEAWQSVTYGNGTFVAIAYGSNIVATSTDGVSWTKHSLQTEKAWTSVTYGNGTFVAVAWKSDVAATSTDGVNWTTHTLPSTQDWFQVIWGNGTFVAVAGMSDIVATSTDGVNWTEGTMPKSANWDSLTFGDGTFVVISGGDGPSTAVASSSDGVNWTEGTMPSKQWWSGVTYGNGTFVAVGGNSNIVATSSGGLHWVEHTLPSSQYWQSVTYGKGTFVAVVWGSNVVATSP